MGDSTGDGAMALASPACEVWLSWGSSLPGSTRLSGSTMLGVAALSGAGAPVESGDAASVEECTWRLDGGGMGP